VGFGTLSASAACVPSFTTRLDDIVSMDDHSRAELRVRLYSICSWCAGLIDSQQGQQPRRRVEAEDLALHVPQQDALWLQMLGISDECEASN
jgi:hypothetical protein